MPTCEQCGNDYDKAFQVTMAGRTMTFDSFECAIQAMAPTCAHCGVRIVGTGRDWGRTAAWPGRRYTRQRMVPSRTPCRPVGLARRSIPSRTAPHASRRAALALDRR